MITALVMAGGRGTRMKVSQEKPLLIVGDQTMIEHVVGALRNAKKVDQIIVTVTKDTPHTAKKAKELSVKTLETPGEDYISDLQYAIKNLHLKTVLTISSDLPLVTNEVIDGVIEYYQRCGEPSLTVMIPLETRKRIGLEADYIFKKEGKLLIPTGLNVIDGQKIMDVELEEETLILDIENIAVNVNTLRDLEIARQMFKQRRENRETNQIRKNRH
ncbi:MAG: NTP transferase domain-containing protein [Thermoproteota archaeon]